MNSQTNELSTTHDEGATEWLFNKAREYPLLTASEEHDIDASKWQARDALLALFAADENCRRYLTLWSDNLLNNPPGLDTFVEREHYYLLRREQADLAKSKDKRALLKALHTQLGKRGKASDKRVDQLIAQLNISPLLVAGFADVVTNARAPGEMAAALLYWHRFWPQPPRAEDTQAAPAQRKLIRQHLRSYYQAREALVNHNLRLVFSIAGKMQSQTVSFPDRVQSGVLGLIRAAEKYDHRTGYRFSTYAYNWINQTARRMLEEQRAIVRFPSDVNDQITRLYRERMTHFNATGEEPSVSVLAQRLDIKPEAVMKLQQIGNLSLSLDSTADGETDGLTLADKLPGWTYSPPSADAEQQSLNRCLKRSLKVLTPQEQSVVTLRWGLAQTAPLSRKEMADHLQVSSERIRQLELSALAKLRDDREVEQAYQDYEATD